MANELSLNQTVQAEVGEFNYLYVNGVELPQNIDLDSINTSINSLDGRVTALEGSSFDSSIVDNLSTNVQALQTRIGTLESLIGLLTNNNTNDTDIEHRISRLEKTILALKAIHDAKKSVYNIPVDW